MTAQRFTFGDDLGRPAQERRRASDQPGHPARAAIDAAEREAFARGVASGREQAAAETQHRLAVAMDRLAAQAPAALGAVDRLSETAAEDAIAFFQALARKLAGRALATQPLAAIEDAAFETFRHLRGVPHLAARVHESLVEPVDALLRSMARERGYEGRIIVIGSDDLAPGDARLEWADGGVVAERAMLDHAVDDVLVRASASPSTSR